MAKNGDALVGPSRNGTGGNWVLRWMEDSSLLNWIEIAQKYENLAGIGPDSMAQLCNVHSYIRCFTLGLFIIKLFAEN